MKYFAATIAALAILQLAQPVHATISLHPIDDTNAHAGYSSQQSDDQRGIKSRIVREFTELLATAIREGGQAASWIISRLDKSAAKSFRKHAGKIADELDRIAKIPDLTTQIVKEKLYYFLRNQLKLSGGTALQIADLVKAALDIFLF